jgi:hypothetical protein
LEYFKKVKDQALLYQSVVKSSEVSDAMVRYM